MKKIILPLLLLAGVMLTSFACAENYNTENQCGILGEHDKIIFTGKTQSFHKEPIPEIKIKVIVDGKEQPIITREADKERGTGAECAPHNEIESASDGEYNAIIYLPKNTAEKSNIKLHIEKPTYKSREIEIRELTKIKDGEYIHYEDITPERHIGAAFYVSAIILILIYILISFEILHRTLAALLGAAFLLFVSYVFGHFNTDFFILSFENAKNYIDFNVIFLLMGMMLIVGVMKRTGVFQWMAFKAYQMAKGDLWKLALILMIVTAFTSAFLDNVTTMLLLTPVSIEIALILRITPWSLLLPEVLASNIGGTATLIGDPPNIMIGSYANLTFMDFVIALTPVVIISMVALIFMMKFKYGGEYKKAKLTPENIDKLLKRLEEEYKITNTALLKHSLVILIFVVILFILHGTFHMEPSIAALIGASLLMISAVVIDKVDVAHMIEREIEWPTLVFFMMLFIVVGAAVETGLIQMIAEGVQNVSGGDLAIAVILILWVSAIMSMIVDNIPFTATMLPIVLYLSQVIPGVEANILWWALALGACFGGNGTLIGASANVVTAGLAEKAGHSITFINFMKVGLPVMIVTMIISTIWMLFVFPHVM
ncbi:MAG: citrate transporter [Candidatus Altiarchaeales archaeon WOR_SM1_86-2]|nr:MAG: citrate transporter [Candidatus Altiarchaeales archaeon WOR_SM1_86-2]